MAKIFLANLMLITSLFLTGCYDYSVNNHRKDGDLSGTKDTTINLSDKDLQTPTPTPEPEISQSINASLILSAITYTHERTALTHTEERLQIIELDLAPGTYNVIQTLETVEEDTFYSYLSFAPTAWGPNGKLTAIDKNTDNIVQFEPDGSKTALYTATTGEKPVALTWAKDKKKMAYIIKTESQPNQYRIWLSNPDGSNSTELTKTDTKIFDMALSPDGSKIAYTTKTESDKTQAGYSIWLLDLERTSQKTTLIAEDTLEHFLTGNWSTTGKNVVYNKRIGDTEDDGFEIWIFDTVDNESQLILTGPYQEALWTPTDTLLIGEYILHSGLNLYEYDPNNKNLSEISDFQNPIEEHNFDWSANGEWFIYTPKQADEYSDHVLYLKSWNHPDLPLIEFTFPVTTAFRGLDLQD